MEDNKMGQLGFKIDTGELATSTIPEDFTAPEELYKKLITMIRKYHPSDDISMIEKAYQIASKAHEGQLRKSGEPYIIHPICVNFVTPSTNKATSSPNSAAISGPVITVSSTTS